VADGVDAAMNAMQPSLARACRPALAVDAHVAQLAEGDHPVLAGRDSRDFAIRVALRVLCIHGDA